jgi:hypothetical protein
VRSRRNTRVGRVIHPIGDTAECTYPSGIGATLCGNGICGYDTSISKARCFCNSGYNNLVTGACDQV